MKKIVLILFVFLNFLFAQTNMDFPNLSGRVVDEVNLLSPSFKAKLENILQEEEAKTSNQIVVVILKSLNGYDIADYSYQLGRYWKIGQEDKNNGVLLVIAQEDRKLRIEVGYGLEGALTDKISHEIIEYTLKPNFRANNYEAGISKAVGEIIEATKGEYVNKMSSNDSEDINDFSPFVFFFVIFFSMILTGSAASRKNLLMYKISKSSMLSSFFGLFSYLMSSEFTQYGLIISFVVFVAVFVFNFINTTKIAKASEHSPSIGVDTGGFSGGFSRGGFSSGGSFSGGFSGGGGSFGGGGASGSW